MTAAAARVIGVIVTYRPDLTQLAALVAALRPQLAGLVMVDNASGDAGPVGHYGLPGDGVQLIVNTDNVGLAAAQNQGIAAARALGASHVLLLDQDSIPDAQMVGTLLASESALRAQGLPVGALGPRCVDRKTGEEVPFIHACWHGMGRVRRSPGQAWAKVDFLIASGCLVPIASFERAGLMDEALFIDQIDVDWCYRLQAAGLACYAVFDATMSHSIGDQAISLLGGLRKQTVHGPLRLYYITRNRLWLYRRPYVPLAWKLHDAYRMVCKTALFVLLIPPRGMHLRAFLRAFRDGLFGARKGA